MENNKIDPCDYDCNCWVEYPNPNYYGPQTNNHKYRRRWSCRDEYEHVGTDENGKVMCRCIVNNKKKRKNKK